MNTTVVTIFVIFIFGCTLACRPILRIYESEGYGDEYVKVAREWIGVNNEPNLTAKGIRNWNTNTCPEGMWMGYEYENYTGSVYILYSYGNRDHLNSCTYQNTGRNYRSVKLVGSTASYQQSAVTTYNLQGNKAIGEDYVYLNDTQNLVNDFTALVITGNEEVELFTAPWFGGLSVCVRPHNGYFATWTGFEQNNGNNGSYIYTMLSNLQSIFGTTEFHSFTFGCRNNTNTLLSTLKH